MENNLEYKELNFDYEEVLVEKQFAVQCEMDTQSKNGIEKISFIKSNVAILEVIPLSKKMQVKGNVNIKVVYLDNDNNIDSYDYISDFTEEIIDQDINENSIVSAVGYIVDNVVSNIGTEIKVQVIVGINGKKIVKVLKNALVDSNNLLIKNKVVECQKFITNLNEKIFVSDTYNAGVSIEEVVYFDSEAIINNVNYANGKVIIEGQTNNVFLYKSEGIITQKNISIPFVYEREGIEDDVKICPNVSIYSSRINIESDSMQNSVSLEVVVLLEGALMSDSREIVADDIFSPEFELKITTSQVFFYEKRWVELEKNRISGTVSEENGDIISKIISSVAVSNVIANILPKDELVIIEGILLINVIYETKDNVIKSNNVELPYSLRYANSQIRQDCILNVDTVVDDVTSRIKRDKEIEVGATILSSICKNCPYNETLIEDVIVGEAKPYDKNGISIYMPQKGETMWDLSKNLGVSIDAIKEQNPELKEEMEGNERVIIYRQLSM